MARSKKNLSIPCRNDCFRAIKSLDPALNWENVPCVPAFGSVLLTNIPFGSVVVFEQVSADSKNLYEFHLYQTQCRFMLRKEVFDSFFQKIYTLPEIR